MAESNEILSVEGLVIGMPLAGPESLSQQQLAYLKKAIGLDETVLFESATAATTGTLSESPANFEKIRVYGNRSGYGTTGANSNLSSYTEVFTRDGVPPSFFLVAALASTNGMFVPHAVYSLSASAFSHSDGRILNMVATPSVTLNSTLIGVLKIVGVHRIAGGN